MAKKETKLSILFAGAEIIRKKGFYNTGLMEILKTAGVPKGSFYFYFDSKEDFGAELVDFFTDYILQNMEAHFTDEGFSPLERMKRFFEERRIVMEEENFKGGCAIGNLTQETGDLSESLGGKLNLALRKMSGKFKECLEEAQSMNEIPQSIDSDSISNFILNSWEGAMLRVKVEHSSEPLLQFEELLFNKILK